MVCQRNVQMRGQLIGEHRAGHVGDTGRELNMVGGQIAQQVDVTRLDVVKRMIDEIEVEFFLQLDTTKTTAESNDAVAVAIKAQHRIVVDSLDDLHSWPLNANNFLGRYIAQSLRLLASLPQEQGL